MGFGTDDYVNAIAACWPSWPEGIDKKAFIPWKPLPTPLPGYRRYIFCISIGVRTDFVKFNNWCIDDMALFMPCLCVKGTKADGSQVEISFAQSGVTAGFEEFSLTSVYSPERGKQSFWFYYPIDNNIEIITHIGIIDTMIKLYDHIGSGDRPTTIEELKTLVRDNAGITNIGVCITPIAI